MHHSHRVFASAAFAMSLMAFSTESGFAQDANAVAQRLKDALAYQGVEIGWTGVSGSGSQVVLDGVTYGVPGAAEKINIGKVTLDAVVENGGGYTIGTMSFPAVSLTEHGMGFKMTAATLSGVQLPPPDGKDYMSNMIYYESGMIDRAELSLGGKQVALVENMHFNMTPPTSGPMSFTAATDKFTADLTALPDPKAKATAQALGYEQITGTMQMAGNWNPQDGRLALSQYDIAVDDAGKLGMTFDVGGYTPEFLQTMQELSKKMGENPDPNAHMAEAMQIMNLVQALVLNGASIRFDDASITNKVLNFVAQQQGADPAQLKEQTKTIIPFLLASSPIKDEALKKNIAEAVAAYLDNPKSLTVRAKPATPQPFAILGALGQADPGSLPTALGLSVSANE
ncbi:MAG: hypothetical protein M9924_14660 [Rhizobiaceae bacterium]|nr:hypothetical protein [Rhizobiaceae bacterium]